MPEIDANEYFWYTPCLGRINLKTKKMKSLFSRSLLLFMLTFSLAHAQKAPKYKPIAGLNKSDVAPLIFASLQDLEDKKLKLVNGQITLDKVDFDKMIFETSHIHYVSMMMHRRARAQFTFKGGKLHIKMIDLAVQNQTAGGKWEASKLKIKGDKKVVDKLANNIVVLAGDPDGVENAKAAFYGDPQMLAYVLEGAQRQDAVALLKEHVSSFGTLTVEDVESNTSAFDGKYTVRYFSVYGEGIRRNYIHHTNNEDVLKLWKTERINGINDVVVLDVLEDGSLVFSSDDIMTKPPVYDYKKLVNTEPIEGVAFEHAFPLVHHALASKGVEVNKINYSGGYITTGWVEIKDGKRDLHGIVTFYYNEGKISTYFLQIMDDKNRNTSCKTDACTQFKQEVSNKIAVDHKNMDLTALTKSFYQNKKIQEVGLNHPNLTSANVEIWKGLIGSK
jgi:hypothetical protein